MLSTIMWIGSSACGGGHAPVRHTPPPGTQSPFPNSVWLLADTQLNNFAGQQDTSKRKDATVSVAIRPATLDLWSETLLAEVVARFATEPHPVFFLGDGANASCIGEFYRFEKAMGLEPTSVPWFAVLGNHDGYYMGNLVLPGDVQSEWSAACRNDAELPDDLKQRLQKWEADVLGGGDNYVGQGMMPKAIAVAMYLDSLHRRKIIDKDPLDAANWTPGPSRTFEAKGAYDLKGSKKPISVFSAVADSSTSARQCSEAEVSAQKKASKVEEVAEGEQTTKLACATGWQAFVVQDVALEDAAHAVLVDTSDFTTTPPDAYVKFRNRNICNLPGVCGRIDSVQAGAIKKFVSAHSENYLVLGHHHWKGISVDGVTNLLAGLEINVPANRSRFVTYVSGHTHDPFATMGFRSDEQWEINIASTTDWPSQYGKLSYNTDAKGQLHHDLQTQVFRVHGDAIDDNSCPLAVSTDDNNELFNELNYFGSLYARRALEMYSRLARTLTVQPPSNAACDAFKEITKAEALQLPTRLQLLKRLAQCDRDELRKDPAVLRVEQKCAAWAARAEQYYYAGGARRLINIASWIIGRPNLQDKKVAAYARALEEGTTVFRVSSKGLPSLP